jgi:serine/threonine protein kinase
MVCNSLHGNSQSVFSNAPFVEDTNHTVFEKILQNRPHFGPDFDPDARDLIEKLLVIDVDKRLGCGKEGAEEIKRHPFFHGINWDLLYQRGILPPLEVRSLLSVNEATREYINYFGDHGVFKDF